MIYLGCSQWNYSFWKGEMYPQGTKPLDYIGYYSKEFNCVELNSTYYDEVEPYTILRWKQSVSPAFRFCPKFPKLISHDRYLKNIQQPTDEFINLVKLFEENLGISYVQLAPSMFRTNIYLLEEFLEYVNNKINVSIEIRPDWLSRPPLLSQCLEILKKYHAGVVIVDGAETVKYLNSIKLTNSSAFIRFLSYNHPTDFERINDWVNMIKFWQDKGIREAYFILHFVDGVSEPPIVNYTLEKFEKELGLKTEDLKEPKLF